MERAIIDGSAISKYDNLKYGEVGRYEYLTTHIYHYIAEQVKIIYIDKIKAFDATDKSRNKLVGLSQSYRQISFNIMLVLIRLRH